MMPESVAIFCLFAVCRRSLCTCCVAHISCAFRVCSSSRSEVSLLLATSDRSSSEDSSLLSGSDWRRRLFCIISARCSVACRNSPTYATVASGTARVDAVCVGPRAFCGHDGSQQGICCSYKGAWLTVAAGKAGRLSRVAGVR